MSFGFHLSLPPLPYEAGALFPAYGASAVSLHHGRIFSSHVDALRLVLDGYPSLRERQLRELLYARGASPRDAEEIRWHAGAVLAHSLYFDSMRPYMGGCPEPMGKLRDIIRQEIGSYAELCYRFREAALSLRGAGFLYLVLTERGRLRLLALRDTEFPSKAEGEPLLCMDLWEHAYFIDYADNRASAVDAFLSVASWDAAEQRLRRLTS